MPEPHTNVHRAGAQRVARWTPDECWEVQLLADGSLRVRHREGEPIAVIPEVANDVILAARSALSSER